MDPLTCFPHMNTSAESYQYDKVDTCSIEVGITPMYPVFNHIGYTLPGQESVNGERLETLHCTCSEEIVSNSELSSQCDQFFMMTGT